MNDVSARLAAAVGIDARPWWRRALSGITPQVIGIIGVLLLIRGVSASVELLGVAIQQHTLAVWVENLVGGFANVVMMTIPMLIVIVATANLGPRHGARRIAALAVAVIASTGVGVVLRVVERFWPDAPDWRDGFEMLAYLWVRYSILAGMLTVVAELYRREVESIAGAHQAELDVLAFERELTAARLQVLQAQIEPHFLFNTLANVRRLYDEDHAAGRTMLDNVMRYLEIALPRMRDPETRLAHESKLIEAFLHIHRIRMGPRLSFTVDIPPELHDHAVPPMMLLTLVENAIKHGINPSPDGGRIRVSARATGDRLELMVADTGAGFASGSGTGTGLANVSGRLASQFGDRANLALENNELGGATATITLPLAPLAVPP